MIFRRLFSTCVVLACTTVVFSAPVTDVYDSVDIEARDYRNLALTARDIGANTWPEVYHYLAHDRRAGSSTKPAPAPKQPAPKQPAPPQSPPKQPPQKQPPQKQPPSKQPPPKQPPPKQPPPKQLPPKQPTPNEPTPKQQPPQQPPQQQPPKQPPTQPKPDSNNNKVCSAVGGKAKRAFSIDCDTNQLTLSGTTRSITKVPNQGNSAVTYVVNGGWPDAALGMNVAAFAKTGRHAGESFQAESYWLHQTNQLLASGTYDGRNFIVFRAVAGQYHITATQYFGYLYQNYLSRGDIEGCKRDVRQKLSAVIPAVRFYVDHYHVLHTDLQPGNILWDQAGSTPSLIDWGRAQEVTRWTSQIEAAVRGQLEFSHLEGAEKICIDLR